MRTVNINDQHFQLHNTWDEIIDSGHYMDVVHMLGSEQDPTLAKYELFRKLTGFDPGALDLTAAGEEQLSEQLVLNVWPCFDFLYDNGLVFTRNPILSFSHRGTTYRGPSAKLNNQTGYQWERSHHLQVFHDHTRDRQYLEQLVYVNYLPDGEPVGEEPLPSDIVYGICLWYGKCEKWWSINFPHIFPSGDDDESSDMPMHKAPPTGREVKDILFKLAGSRLNADWDIVRSRTRQDIVYALDEMEKERERIESQRKAQ